MSESSNSEWYQSALLQFCAASILSLVLTVLAAVLKDLRWLLVLVWPLATVACWEFARVRSSQWTARWAGGGAVVSGGVILLLYLYLGALSADIEDLRVTFLFESLKPNAMRVTYLFRNFLGQASVVNLVGLYEITSLRNTDNEFHKTGLCEEVYLNPFRIFTMNSMTGQSSRYGDIDRQDTAYMPDALSLTIDGVLQPMNAPISIEGGKSKNVIADFTLDPEHMRGYKYRTLCPVVFTTDIENVRSAVVCGGLLESKYFQKTWSFQYRILPRANPYECPYPRSAWERLLMFFPPLIGPPAEAPPFLMPPL
jgi:hypothetical protein